MVQPDGQRLARGKSNLPKPCWILLPEAYFVNWDDWADVMDAARGTDDDYVMTDVSRGWPCNGKFNERQTLLYNIALETSNHMFSIIKPGMAMKDVDGESHRYCASF